MYSGGYELYGDGFGYGLGEAYPLLPPGDVLKRMTHKEVLDVMHKLAQAEYTAKQEGNTAAADAARTARLEASRIYTALGTQDVSRLDRAAMALDRFNHVVATSVKELVVGAAGTAGKAIGEAAKGALPVLPFALLALGLWAILRGGSGGRGLW